MPIFSAAKHLTFAQDTYFKLTTLRQWNQTPEYSFHFAPPSSAQAASFENDCFLDNGRSALYAHPIECSLPNGHRIDVNEYCLHYQRLFALKHLGHYPARFYLVPWLCVPYSPPTKPGGMHLSVSHQSVYDARLSKDISAKIKRAHDAAVSSGATPPTLELHPSDTDLMTATWDPTGSSLTASSSLDEVDCRTPRDITIKFKTSPTTYLEYVDITRGPTDVVGRLNIFFAEKITKKAFLFDVTNKPTNNDLTFKMLGATDTVKINDVTKYPYVETTKTANQLMDQLNNSFRKAGVEFTLGTDSLTSTFTLSNPSVDFSKSTDPNDVLNLLFEKFVKNLPDQVRRDSIFIFFAGWVLPILDAARKDGDGLTTGVSEMGWRTSCIYGNDVETLSHEVSHALGLPHYFFHTKDGAPKPLKDAINWLVTRVEANLAAGEISDEAQFYSLHDAMNSGNSCETFAVKFYAPNPSDPPILTVKLNFYNVNIDQFELGTTHNLMDYNDKPIAKTKLDLTKHQIELIRYFIEQGEHTGSSG